MPALPDAHPTASSDQPHARRIQSSDQAHAHETASSRHAYSRRFAMLECPDARRSAIAGCQDAHPCAMRGRGYSRSAGELLATKAFPGTPCPVAHVLGGAVVLRTQPLAGLPLLIPNALAGAPCPVAGILACNELLAALTLACLPCLPVLLQGRVDFPLPVEQRHALIRVGSLQLQLDLPTLLL